MPDTSISLRDARRSLWLVAFAILALAPALPAAYPPRPGELERLRASGQLDRRAAAMRALGQHQFRPEALQAWRERARAQLTDAGLALPQPVLRLDEPQVPPANWRGLPTTGAPKSLTVLLDFADLRAATLHPGATASTIQANLYGPGTAWAQENAVPLESMNAFYRRASCQKLDLQGAVLGWYNLPNNRATYASLTADPNNTTIFNLVKEALNSYNASHDFAVYDNNADGYLDLVNIFYTGDPGDWGSFWWAYSSQFSYSSTTWDGKRLRDFTFSWLPLRGDDDFDPRVVIHEVGHALGLPDYYDYDPDAGPNGGAGAIDMMDSGARGNHNAFSRWVMDWITPALVASGEPVARPLQASGLGSDQQAALALFPGLASGPFTEFFLVENRTREGNDEELPGDGCLVWHVSASVLDGDYRHDNSYTARKLLQLVQADGLSEVELKDEAAGAEDYYRFGATFTPTSQPPSDDGYGNPTGVIVRDFGAPGPVMTVTAGFSPEPLSIPTLAEALDHPTVPFYSDGDADLPWVGQRRTTADQVDAARSGAIGDQEETWIDSSVTGPGILQFDWKVSSEEDYDFLEFYRNSRLQQDISGEVDWTTVTHFLATGTHTLRWRYHKDQFYTGGLDSAWLDRVRYTRDIHYLTLSAAPGGTALASPAQPFYALDSVISLQGNPNSGFSFLGWTGDFRSPANPATLVLSGNQTILPLFGQSLTNSGGELPAALWYSGGDQVWFPQSVTQRDGTPALQSGPISHNQATWVTLDCTGPGTLSFFWKCSTEPNADWLEVRLDEILVERISGAMDWTLASLFVPAGPHRLRWLFSRDASNPSPGGSNAAWLDGLAWQPSASFSAWQSSGFSPEQLADPSISGLSASPARDGLSNLAKYALGIPPFAFDPARLPTASSVPGPGPDDPPHARLRFTLRDDDPALAFRVEVSDDLRTWHHSADGSGLSYVEITPEPALNGWRTYSARDLSPLAPDGPARHLRLVLLY